MDLKLCRVRYWPTHTTGQLYVNGDFFCFTLEDVVREVPGQPVAQWKIQNETAIPSGVYNVSFVDSPHFGPNTINIDNVPGFSYIHMHAGNTEADTDGCILLGYKLDPDTGVIVFGTTRPAVADLKGTIQRAFDAEEKVTLTIVNIPK